MAAVTMILIMTTSYDDSDHDDDGDYKHKRDQIGDDYVFLF